MKGLCKSNLKLLALILLAFVQPTNASETPLEPRAIMQFSSTLHESSALASRGKNLWTLNDSGNGALIFKLDNIGNELNSFRMANTINSDWESLASDAHFLYIGDIGNNFNRRRKLTIYRIAWEDIEKPEPSAQRITFIYADRRSGLPMSHDFDAEAIAIHGNEIWLFTKNRGDRNSNLYRFPKLPGHYRPKTTQVLPVNSLVTAADIHPKTRQLVLISTKKTSEGGKTLLWLAPTSDAGVDWANHKSMEIAPHDQWEAVVWDSESSGIFLTHENNKRGFAGLAKLSQEALSRGLLRDYQRPSTE